MKSSVIKRMRKDIVPGSFVPANAGMFLFLVCVLFLPPESFGGHHEAGRYDALNGYGKRYELVSSDQDGGSLGHIVAISGDVAVVGSPDNSVYVFDRNSDGTWSQSQKFSSSAADTNFGAAVAISGGTIVVGAQYEGSVYIYERSADGVWLQSQKLSSSAADTSFGDAVAISGDKMIVSEDSEDSAYIYEKGSNGTWVLKRKFTVSGSRAFGYDVAISGDRAIVGAPDTRFSVFYKDGADAAYVYERNASGTWSQSQVLTTGGENLRGLTYFGSDVGISGDSLIVGSSSTSHIFERNAEGNYVLRLTRSNTSGRPGYIVGISGDKALAGPQNSTRIRVMKKAGQAWLGNAWILHMRDLDPATRLSKKYKVSTAGISGGRAIVRFGNSSDDQRIFVYELIEAGTARTQPVVNEQGPDADTEPSSPGGEEQPGTAPGEPGTPANDGQGPSGDAQEPSSPGGEERPGTTPGEPGTPADDGQGPSGDARQQGSVVVIEETLESDEPGSQGIEGGVGNAGDGLPPRSGSGGCAISGENRFASPAFLAMTLVPLLFFGRFRKSGKRFPSEKRFSPPV